MRIQNHLSRILVRSTTVVVRSTTVVLALLAACLTTTAQQTASTKPASPPTMASMMESQLGMVERQFVAAAEAMPENKYSFAPAGANFTGVRTFALEVRHAATANFVIYSAILGQDPPAGVTVDGAANGPRACRRKSRSFSTSKTPHFGPQSHGGSQQQQPARAAGQAADRNPIAQHSLGSGHLQFFPRLRSLRSDGGVPPHERHRSARQRGSATGESFGEINWAWPGPDGL